MRKQAACDGCSNAMVATGSALKYINDQVKTEAKRYKANGALKSVSKYAIIPAIGSVVIYCSTRNVSNTVSPVSNDLANNSSFIPNSSHVPYSYSHSMVSLAELDEAMSNLNTGTRKYGNMEIDEDQNKGNGPRSVILSMVASVCIYYHLHVHHLNFTR